MENRKKNFIGQLASAKQLPDVYNQYSFTVSANEVRRENLMHYFSHMSRLKPEVLLVGEAPGYHGCRLTGVPFTSEYILLKNDSIFGKRRGYRKTTEVSGLKKEQTATVIWETLNNHDFVPLMWNAFPFHPHEVGNPLKNRTPSKKELEFGQMFLKEIMDMFGIKKVVAIGKKAEASLTELNIPCSGIRHPANGGKPEFVQGVRGIILGLTYQAETNLELLES